MNNRTLLWLDLTLQKSPISPTRYFDEFFHIRRTTPGRLSQSDDPERPHALCFDFDFPDRAGLKLLEDTKRLHPSIPLVMLTVQHSEELAIWAFRTRVWDYYIKPVSRRDVARFHESLHMIDMAGSKRRPVHTNTTLPTESRLARFSSSSKRALAPSIAYVESHYAEKIVQCEMAAICGMSTFQFSRMFHQEFNRTFQDFLLKYRVERAAELLRNPTLGVSSVAFSVGFHDASYFGRVFRKLHNMSPTQWRHHMLNEERPALRVDGPE